LNGTRYADRRVAFACMVSHAYRNDHAAGGTVCGPLIRKLFESLEPVPAARLKASH
jgi:hypothetical protein